MNDVIIVGGGITAAHAASELRDQGHSGPITLISAETHLPYNRPPLSKGLLLNTEDVDSIYVHDRAWYADHEITLRLGTEATALDTKNKTVVAGQDTITYDNLLLATGSSPRRLDIFEESELNVAYLRTLENSLNIKAKLKGKILIIGAGWIGLEIASAARQAGASVTVVETAELPLLGVLGDELANVFAELHREHGVDLRLATSIDSVDGKKVTLSDCHQLTPDLVIVGIGANPNVALARGAGLDTDNGVLVDAQLTTSSPNIFAAGDIANHDHPTLGRIRVEHWDNAIEQGKHAARAILGSTEPYTRLPYFFTDQYDVGMEYVGHPGTQGFDEVIVTGDKAQRALTAYWLKGDEVVAGMHLNTWDAIDKIRKVVRTGPVDRAELTSLP